MTTPFSVVDCQANTISIHPEQTNGTGVGRMRSTVADTASGTPLAGAGLGGATRAVAWGCVSDRLYGAIPCSP